MHLHSVHASIPIYYNAHNVMRVGTLQYCSTRTYMPAGVVRGRTECGIGRGPRTDRNIVYRVFAGQRNGFDAVVSHNAAERIRLLYTLVVSILFSRGNDPSPYRIISR